MEWSLVFHDVERGVARVALYSDGRMLGEEVFEGVEAVEVKDAEVLAARGLGAGVRVFSLPGRVRAERLGARLLIKPV